MIKKFDLRKTSLTISPFSIRMCLTVDQIEQACGIVLLNESNRFVYCCRTCHREYESAPNFQEHILSEHLDDKSTIECSFVNDGILLTDCAIETTFENSAPEALDEAQRSGLAFKTEKESLSSEWIDQTVEEKYEAKIEIEMEIQSKDAEKKKRKQKIVKHLKTKWKTNKGVKIDAEKPTEMVENKESCEEKQKNPVNEHDFNAIEIDQKHTIDSDENPRSTTDKALEKNNADNRKRCKVTSAKQKSKAQNTTDPSSKSKSPAKQVFYCEICPDITLSTYYILRAHMRRHRENRFRTKICQICNKKARDIEKHMRLNHMEKKPYKCDFCDNRFTTNMSRLNHMRVHTRERPFLCDQCGNFLNFSHFRLFNKNESF